MYLRPLLLPRKALPPAGGPHICRVLCGECVGYAQSPHRLPLTWLLFPGTTRGDRKCKISRGLFERKPNAILPNVSLGLIGYLFEPIHVKTAMRKNRIQAKCRPLVIATVMNPAEKNVNEMSRTVVELRNGEATLAFDKRAASPKIKTTSQMPSGPQSPFHVISTALYSWQVPQFKHWLQYVALPKKRVGYAHKN